MDAILKGTAIGFAIAAPVGPIGVLCIRRSIADGRLAGFVTGLGAAAADSIYGFIAAFGVTALIDWFTRHQTPIRLLGGIFLLYLGLSMLRSKVAIKESNQPVHARTLFVAFIGALVLTLANPLTIAAFTGIFAALGLGPLSEGYWSSVRLVLGVAIGSSSWWLLLSGMAGWMSPRLKAGRLNMVNQLAGGLILVVGVWQLIAIFVKRA